MAVTVSELSNHLEASGIKHEVKGDDTIVTGFRTKHYVNTEDGDHGILVVVRLQEGGEYIQLFSPQCYQYPANGEHAPAVFQTLLFTSWRTKLVQFEYDPSDGEIRAVVEWPVEDGTVTRRQLERALSGLAEIVDVYDPMIRTAIEEGRFDPSLVEIEVPGAAAFLEMLERMARELRSHLSGDSGAGGQQGDAEEPLDLEE